MGEQSSNDADVNPELRERLRASGRTGKVAGLLVIAAVVVTAATRVSVVFAGRGILAGPILGGVEVGLYFLIFNLLGTRRDGLDGLVRIAETAVVVHLIELVVALVLMIRLLGLGQRLIREGEAARRSWIPRRWPSILTVLFLAGSVEVGVFSWNARDFGWPIVVGLVGTPAGLALLLYARHLLPEQAAKPAPETLDELDPPYL